MEFNGEHDHMHLLVNHPPKVVSNLVASPKGVSSRLLRQQFGNFHPWLKRRSVLWSPSHFASSCGGAPADILQYIEEQRTLPLDAQVCSDLGLNPEASCAFGERALRCQR